jgi:hypothetical protein
VKVSRSQDQTAGEGSTNLQAGRDIVYHGVTAAEARQIALDVYNANFLKLVGVAENVARDRAEQITRDYLEKLQAENPDGLNSVQDPDMLNTILSAQKAFAYSGEEDLEKVLVDLLVDRSGQVDRELKTLVLNEAITVLPKLSIRQRKSIALWFFIRYARYVGPLDLNLYYASLADGVSDFVGMLSDRRADYEHIQATGAGAISAFSWQIGPVFTASASGFFTNGFTEDQIDDDLRQLLSDRDIFIPCIRDPMKWQVNVTSQQDAGPIASAKNIGPGRLENLAGLGWMPAPEIQADVISRIPETKRLFDCWSDPASSLEHFELTSVGKAIGHAYWRQATGASAPLDIWL